LQGSSVKCWPWRCANTPRHDQSTWDGPMVARLTVNTGDRYGSLTIVTELPPKQLKHHSVRTFLARCDCGNMRTASLSKMRIGKIKSCEKCGIERCRQVNVTHGMRKSAEYGIWTAMLARCNNPNTSSYAIYGGRGVAVCDRWDPSKGGSFDNFIADMGKRPSHDYQLDKEAINPSNKIYCPEMVRWVSRKENMRNTRRSKFLTYQGQTLLLSEWAEKLGVNIPCLHRRLYKYNWTIDRAFTTPSRYKQPARI